MIRTTVRFGDVVTAAAARCGLTNTPVTSPRAGRPVSTLGSPGGRRVAFVYQDGDSRTINWPSGRDADVLAYLGEDGRRLMTAVILAEAEIATHALGLRQAVHAGVDGRVTITFQKDGPMDGTIKCIISPKGAVKIEVDGVSGPTCTELTKALVARFGTIEKQELTHEYNEEIPVENKVEASN